MTTQSVELELQPRELLGKKVGRLRRTGIIPVHLYGPGIESRPLQCAGPRLVQALTLAGGNTPISVTIEGEPGSHLALAREIQWDPRRDVVLHVDLLAVDVLRPVSAQVPVVLVGEAPGARGVGGTVNQQVFNLEVQALPLDMPAQVEIDLERLATPEAVVRVGELDLGAAVTVLSDSEEIVVRIDVPRSTEESAGGDRPMADSERGTEPDAESSE